MHDELDHENGRDDDGNEGLEFPIELETASQVLLEMRSQNVDLLKLAAQIAGYSGGHSPLKPGELRQAINAVWEVYSQLYQWIDPEDTEDDDEEDEE
jgi:hypothetical protein